MEYKFPDLYRTLKVIFQISPSPQSIKTLYIYAIYVTIVYIPSIYFGSRQ
jgi:hypothetical protein